MLTNNLSQLLSEFKNPFEEKDYLLLILVLLISFAFGFFMQFYRYLSKKFWAKDLFIERDSHYEKRKTIISYPKILEEVLKAEKEIDMDKQKAIINNYDEKIKIEVNKQRKIRDFWGAFFSGFMERFVFIIAVGYSVPGVLIAFFGWVTVKTTIFGNVRQIKGNKALKDMLWFDLKCTLGSLLFAIYLGLVIKYS